MDDATTNTTDMTNLYSERCRDCDATLPAGPGTQMERAKAAGWWVCRYRSGSGAKFRCPDCIAHGQQK